MSLRARRYRTIAAGDIATCSGSGDEATAALLGSLSGDIITIGDNVYQSGTTTEFNTCFNPSWGRVKATHPPDGRESRIRHHNAAGYFAYFGAAAGDPTKGYYSYNYGAWHIVVLNSGNCARVACNAGSPQEQWLRADLAASHGQCTLAVWHHPRFSSGTSHGNDASVLPFYQALYDYNADVILNGHEHNYERFAPQSPSRRRRSCPRRSGSSSLAPAARVTTGSGRPLPNSEVRNSDTYGVLALHAQAGWYAWQFVPEAGKTFTDTGSAACHDANGPVTDLSAPLNGTTPLTNPSFVDSTAVNGVTYRYVVTAVNTSGQESQRPPGVGHTGGPFNDLCQRSIREIRQQRLGQRCDRRVLRDPGHSGELRRQWQRRHDDHPNRRWASCRRPLECLGRMSNSPSGSAPTRL